MRYDLLPSGKPYFKANLHCHTNISDGNYSPEEIKRMYMEKGYSIVAFTDHEILIPHPELNDENFLALNGYEYEIISPEKPGNPAHKLRKTCHMCLIALEPDNLTHVCWHGKLWGNAVNYRDQAVIRKYEPIFEPAYNGECISHVMQTGRKNGFFVTYNHPVWSMEDMVDIQNYHGMHAMEIYNHGCIASGFDDYVPAIYEAKLRRDERIYCIASDDTHAVKDLFGGWVMISADKLEYRTITKALEDGRFYATTGPEIKELWYEDGQVHVRCSPAKRIRMGCGTRTSRLVKAEGEPVTEAVFPVEKDDIFFRITITAADGTHADTNAYFLDNF